MTLPALKERAGVVNALVDGRQTVLVRDPDLPPGDDADAFALYPSYTHQNPDRYGERDVQYYHESRAKPDAGIPLRAVATVADRHVVDAERVASLAPHYVYTASGLREKYGLDDGQQASVLVLRVRRLDEPTLVDERSAYRGCRSWIDLHEGVNVDPSASTPVLDDPTFAERAAAVRAALS